MRVNAVAPGPVDTGMLDRFAGSDERKNALAAGVPLKRLGQPDDIAQAIVFLASRRPRSSPARSIDVNGGKTAF